MLRDFAGEAVYRDRECGRLEVKYRAADGHGERSE